MNKLLSLILLTVILISHSAYAETVKSSKKIKSADTNQTMSYDEFMKKMMALDKREKDAIKQGETLDEINQLLGVEK